jgi:hypothetical protein
VQPIFGFLLTCLLTLHIYWQYLMIGILFTYAKKGVAEDTVNDLKISKKKSLMADASDTTSLMIESSKSGTKAVTYS